MALHDEMKTEILLRLMEQHWQHCRHIENERGWFMVYYAIAVTGGLVSSMGSEIDFSLIGSGNFDLSWIFYFILIFTFFGFSQNIRWSYAFESHRIRVNSLIMKIQKTCLLSIDNIQLPTMEIEPMEFWEFKGIFRTRYLFPLFYYVILILCVVFFQGWMQYMAVVALIIASSLGYKSRSSFKKLDDEDHLITKIEKGDLKSKMSIQILLKKKWRRLLKKLKDIH
jgi:hypothetical protein